jgi:Pyrimidine dimer DNA glycosylase
MRLWSLHPRYLDAKGLVAVWREGLLARAVLRGETRGYRHHPQLERFRAHPSPRLAIDAYLLAIHAEAVVRGYSFDRRKLGPRRKVKSMAVTRGQLEYEWAHLMRKLALRSPALFEKFENVKRPAVHELFRSRPGPVAVWERPGG